MRGYGDSEGKHAFEDKLQREEPERAMRLMEALSDVDQALLERCAGTGRVTACRRPLWQSARAAAAVLCLAVVGAASWGGYQLSRTRMGGADSSGGAAAPYMEEIREDAEEAVPRDEVTCDTAPEAAGAEDAVEAGQGGEQIRQTEADKFMDGQYADGGEMPPGQESAIEEEGRRDGSGTGGDAVEENGSPEDTAGCPLPPQSQKLTLAQAREDAALGAYVPTALPAGYAFEEGHRVTESQEPNLTLCWIRGMDSIMLHLERTANPPATVDVEETESYDQRLYEVPYGETVPEEYRQTFDNPVFAVEDFNLEIVKSRIKSYDDQGDTDTPRGNFSVLYEGGVLIRFNGRGTAEEIWEMFCSMGGQE
jgi:hypothetical protein